MEGVTDYHVRVRGWKTNGYHFLVTKDGVACRTPRRLDEAGAHTQGANDSLGVVVAGDGDHEPWRLAQWRGVLALLVRLCQEYGFGAEDVCGHREAPARLRAAATAKSCPGRLVDLDEVRDELAAALAEARRSS